MVPTLRVGTIKLAMNCPASWSGWKKVTYITNSLNSQDGPDLYPSSLLTKIRLFQTSVQT